jgi:hypothetical protein
MAFSALSLSQWARQDQNTLIVSREIPQMSTAGAVKSAVEPADASFADAVAGILALPLTDSQKAEAVRRLLTCNPAHPDLTKPNIPEVPQ